MRKPFYKINNSIENLEVQKAVERKNNNPKCRLKINLEKEFSVTYLSGYGKAL